MDEQAHRQGLMENIALEITCDQCGESATGADIQHDYLMENFAEVAFKMGWRMYLGQTRCPECA